MLKRNLFVVLAATLSTLSCNSTSEPDPPPVPIPTAITVTPAVVTLSSIGGAQNLTSVVTDQNGETINATLTWTSTSPTVVTVSARGVVQAVSVGVSQVTARAGTAVSNIVNVSVSPVADSIAKITGDDQTGVVGAALPVAITVIITDASGTVSTGLAVTFAPVSGTVPVEQVNTDAAGQATTNWTLGTVAGTQTLNVSVGPAATTFTATAIADVPDTIRMVSGDAQTALAATALPESLVVMIVDQFGNPVDGARVTFNPTSGGGSTNLPAPATRPDGRARTEWTLGPAAGANTVDAIIAGINGSPVVFTATGTDPAAPTAIAVSAGSGQDLLAGAEAVIRPTALVTDMSGVAVSGVTVDFAVTAGGGTLGAMQAVTDASGLATSGAWTYGATPGTNSVSATLTGTGIAAAAFTGEGVTAGFNIDVVQLDTPSAEVATAFTNAKAKWEALVASELGDVDFGSQVITADACGITHPSFAGTVDDVMIWVRLEAIDGSGGVLGSAGPCFTRTTGTTTIVGTMRFDTADLADLVAAGTIESVILHEMGHVLGIGTLWKSFGFLQDSSLDDSGNTIPGADTHFDGPTALAAFATLGGGSYTGGAIVPVENSQGGAGTQDGHWRETTFTNELMTGFISAGSNPLSLLSVASLADLGLAINPGAADAYVQVFTVSGVAAGIGVQMIDDVFDGPRYTVGPQGQITRIR